MASNQYKRRVEKDHQRKFEESLKKRNKKRGHDQQQRRGKKA